MFAIDCIYRSFLRNKIEDKPRGRSAAVNISASPQTSTQEFYLFFRQIVQVLY